MASLAQQLLLEVTLPAAERLAGQQESAVQPQLWVQHPEHWALLQSFLPLVFQVLRFGCGVVLAVVRDSRSRIPAALRSSVNLNG